MVAGLRSRDVKVFFVHHGETPAGSDDGLALKSLTGSHRYIISSPRTKRIITELLQRERVELVHVSLSFSTSVDFGLPDLCHELGVPVTATFHVPYDSRFSLWQGISSALYRVYSQSLAAYDRVIIFSNGQRELLVQYGVPETSIAVVPNGVDVDKYAPAPSDFKAMVGAETLIGYLGRVDPEKNVLALVRAFLDVDVNDQDVLVVVGGGGERRRLQRRFGGRRVVFTGPVMDVFVLPSAVEGLSLSLLEAMACGAACIATDVGGDGEALRGAGIVLDPKELDGQLRLGLQTLLDFPDFRRDLGRRARARAVESYSLARNLDHLLAIYESLRERKPGQAAAG
jgi:glycosyltransferase involved in cell wall biosynthesis